MYMKGVVGSVFSRLDEAGSGVDGAGKNSANASWSLSRSEWTSLGKR